MTLTDPILTADDVVRAGACADGVHKVLFRMYSRGALAAAMPVSVVVKLLRGDERAYALRAADLDGDGYGYGETQE